MKSCMLKLVEVVARACKRVDVLYNLSPVSQRCRAERHSNSGVSQRAVMFSRLRRDEHEQGVAAVLQIVGRIGTSLVVVDASRLGFQRPEVVRSW
jgi:hypothetical protein